jgi:hypothetical protein
VTAKPRVPGAPSVAFAAGRSAPKRSNLSARENNHTTRHDVLHGAGLELGDISQMIRSARVRASFTGH